MFVELKHIYWKLMTSLREKRLRKQKAMIQMRIMSDFVRRVK